MALNGPGVLDHEADVFLQQGLELGSLGLRVDAHVAIEGRDCCGLTRDHRLGIFVHLPRRHRDEAHQQPVEDTERGEEEPDQIVVEVHLRHQAVHRSTDGESAGDADEFKRGDNQNKLPSDREIVEPDHAS